MPNRIEMMVLDVGQGSADFVEIYQDVAGTGGSGRPDGAASRAEGGAVTPQRVPAARSGR